MPGTNNDKADKMKWIVGLLDHWNVGKAFSFQSVLSHQSINTPIH
jgi:hypothetical protein